jgi:hypothetical protein
MKPILTFALLLALALPLGCTQETQNRFGRAVQNWTGTDGVLEIYAGDKLVRRFLEIDKLTTASGTQGGESRPYRFGYGVLDANLNGRADRGEAKVYFEFSDYSTSYVFFEAKGLNAVIAGEQSQKPATPAAP